MPSTTYDDVPYQGIEEITPDDLAYAKDLGLSLKLIGSAERVNGGLSVRVYPAFLYGKHPLASVNGAFNAVTIESPAITEITMSASRFDRLKMAEAATSWMVSARE